MKQNGLLDLCICLTSELGKMCEEEYTIGPKSQFPKSLYLFFSLIFYFKQLTMTKKNPKRSLQRKEQSERDKSKYLSDKSVIWKNQF